MVNALQFIKHVQLKNIDTFPLTFWMYVFFSLVHLLWKRRKNWMWMKNFNLAIKFPLVFTSTLGELVPKPFDWKKAFPNTSNPLQSMEFFLIWRVKLRFCWTTKNRYLILGIYIAIGGLFVQRATKYRKRERDEGNDGQMNWKYGLKSIVLYRFKNKTLYLLKIQSKTLISNWFKSFFKWHKRVFLHFMFAFKATFIQFIQIHSVNGETKKQQRIQLNSKLYSPIWCSPDLNRYCELWYCALT